MTEENDRIDDGEQGVPIHSGEVTHEEYWFLQVNGIEWTYVVQTLIEKHLKDAPILEKPIIIGQTLDNHVLFMLKKRFLPAEAIALVTGIALDVINTVPTLKLNIKPRPDLPKPTVDYWGKA